MCPIKRKIKKMKWKEKENAVELEVYDPKIIW